MSTKVANGPILKGLPERRYTDDNKPLSSTDPKAAHDKTLLGTKKEISKVVENITSGIVIDKITTFAPKDYDNQLAKSNGESGYFTEYLVTKAPITFDNLNLASPQDLYRYFVCKQVKTTDSLKGTDIAIGSIVNLTKKSPDSDDYFISEVVSQGTLAPGVDLTSAFGNSANAFNDPRCNPQEVRPSGDKVNAPQAPVDNNAAPTPNMPQNVIDCSKDSLFTNTPPSGTILDWGKTNDPALDERLLKMVINAAERFIPDSKNHPKYIRCLMAIVNNECGAGLRRTNNKLSIDNIVGDLEFKNGPSIGPMQVYRQTAIDYKFVDKYITPDQYISYKGNVQEIIDWGVRVFVEKLKIVNGDVVAAIRRYNGGINNQTAVYQANAIQFIRKTYKNLG
jgi:hypothetical protein